MDPRTQKRARELEARLREIRRKLAETEKYLKKLLKSVRN